MNTPSVGVLVSVRTNSKRLPAKAFLPINGKPSCLFLLDRLKDGLNFPLHVATTSDWSDNYLSAFLENHGYSVYRGSNENVFERLLDLSKAFNFEYLVRITADCPFLDSALVNDLIDQAFDNPGWTLATTKGVHPAGLDIEILSVHEMSQVASNLSDYDKEHVTSFFYSHLPSENIFTLRHPNLSVKTGVFLLDTIEDFISLNEFIDSNGGTFLTVSH